MAVYICGKFPAFISPHSPVWEAVYTDGSAILNNWLLPLYCSWHIRRRELFYNHALCSFSVHFYWEWTVFLTGVLSVWTQTFDAIFRLNKPWNECLRVISWSLFCCTSITVMKIKPVKTARESNRSWASAPGAGWWVWNSPRPFVFLFSEFHCAVRKNNVENESKMFGFVPGQTLANHDFRDPWMVKNPAPLHKKLYFWS